MKTMLTVFFLTLSTSALNADGFMMGAGRWTCDQVGEVMQGDSAIEKGQIIGWILGAWSHASSWRESAFVDKVEAAGGRKIFDATLAQCQKASGDTLLYRVVNSMIKNTK